MRELTRTLPVRQIGALPVAFEVVASADECAAVAGRLRIPAVAALRCRFMVTGVLGGRIRAEGRLEARVTQESVVSLEPVEQRVAEAFEVLFVPAGEMAEDFDELDLDEPDELPIEGDAMDLGEATVQQLALALDPYPRRAGEALAAADEGVVTPFAKLAALRKAP